MSTDPETRILAASFELFSHFGFKKTTMGEIAKRAGVSRPTLYARFDSKEQVFASVVDSYIGRIADEVVEETRDCDSLHDKLAVAFDIAIVRPFRQTSGHAFKQELLELDDPRINESLEGAHDTVDRLLTKLIRESDVDLKKLGTTAPKLGRMINTAARGFKEGAKNEKELRQMLDGLVRLVGAATNEVSS